MKSSAPKPRTPGATAPAAAPNGGFGIPPQPAILLEIRELIRERRCEVRDLVRAISTDPGIAAALFKTARLPVFGIGAGAQSLDEIVSTLGIRQTLNLVQACAMSSVLTETSLPAYELFWTRSQEIAQLAAIIADERVSVCNIFPEQAFLAGMFHGCGVPVLMQRFPDYAEALQIGLRWPSVAEEDARYGVDHGNIGYLIARHWGLPDFVCAAILHQNELPSDERAATRTLVAIVLLATHCHELTRSLRDTWWSAIRDDALYELGIDAEGERAFVDEINERFFEGQVDWSARSKAAAQLGF